MIKKKFCKVSYLDQNSFFKTWVNEFRDEIIIFKRKNKIYVKSAVCPHFGGPISFDKDKDYLFCYWHGLKFSAVEGKCLNQKSFKPCIIDYLYEVKKNYIYVYKK